MFKQLNWLVLVILLFFISACSGGDETPADSTLPEGVSFQPIDAVVDSELIVTNFANDGTASLPIETTVPVACSIVYGKTPEFGSLSLDLDMAGGAHSVHNPLLSGLDPETEYYFRVQGVDEDGIVYVSETLTFTTPPRDASQSENLASADRGAEVIGYSSAFGSADPGERWGALGAFDDNPNTEWSTDGDGNDAWIEVKLAGPAHISAVEFQSRAMPDGSAITEDFTITTDRDERFGPFSLPDPDSGYRFELDTEAETLRFDLVETTGGNTGAVDIIVYGELLDQ